MMRRAFGLLGVLLAVGTRAFVAQGPSPASPPTFATDVAPIVYGRCIACHRPGQAGPFPLTSYEEVKRRGDLIVRATGRRYMPPWHATSADGFPEFRDDRRLSDREIATLRDWVVAGMPSGDLSRAPAPPTFAEGWALGRPDVELQFAREIDVPADGPDQYRNVVLPLNLPDEKWITAIDFEPSARKVVHHALFFVTPAADSASIGSDDVVPGFGGAGRGRGLRGGLGQNGAERGGGGIGGWVPGMTPRFFPEGIAQRLPPNSNLVVQLHLHPSGKPEAERGRLALYFASEPPAKSLVSFQVPPVFGFAKGIDIPPGEAHYEIEDALVLPADVEAFGARGHAHYLARNMKMTATLPDGSTKGLLWIDDWDFGWQDSYFYKTPFVLPKGTRIEVRIAYDNSASNIRNPSDPPKRVTWGRGSLDEMGSMSLLVAPRSTADEALLRQAQAAHFRRQLAELFLRR
jgi:mono/diheme cytochrome c family protein